MNFQNEITPVKPKTDKELIEELLQTVEELKEKINILERKVEVAQSTGLFLWRIPHFNVEKQKHSKLTSETFYTHQLGYRLRIELYPNGNAEGKNTHVSVYYRIVSGQFDDIVVWPFGKGVCITLLDLNEDTEAISNLQTTFYINPHYTKKLAFEKPPPGKVNLLNWGTDTFVSHQQLEKSTYIKNDTIYILVRLM